ncbi:hypothetical protein DPMN_178394 [Dreissena polymorpha]|uniref:Uncharacterized protein n=1 Tax=Dreissena polymorpha TaxID=45954 RepID=A0A9D4IJU5_DREPO|nr:hypothetical protein DPMN_178394 [Dreissena polymorpha]
MAIRHEKITSERSIFRVLRRYRLTRGQSQHSLEEIIQGMLLELSASGENAGYRQMRQRLLINHGLAATFEMVRLILGLIDPQGVALRPGEKVKAENLYKQWSQFCYPFRWLRQIEAIRFVNPWSCGWIFP